MDVCRCLFHWPFWWPIRAGGQNLKDIVNQTGVELQLGKEALTDQVHFSNWSSCVFEVFCGFYWGVFFLEWMALTGNMLFSPSCCAAIAGWPGGAIDWYSKPAGSSYPHCFKCSVALSQQICSDGNAEFRHLWRVSGWCCVKKGTIMQLAQTV